MARLAPQFSLVLVAICCLLPPSVLPGALLHRSVRQAEEKDTNDVKIDAAESEDVKIAEADVVEDETVGDKQMDATAIEDAAAEVVEEKEEEMTKEEEMMKEDETE